VQEREVFMQKNIIWMFCLSIFLFQCKEPAPLEIKPLPYPADAFKIKSIITKELYKTNGSFQAGYQSGKILSDRIVLEWQESQRSHFLCYKIFRNDAEQMVIPDKSVVSKVDSGLIQNSYYDYRLVHMTRDGVFFSDTLRIKTPRFASPGQFTYQVLSETSIKLYWTNRTESADKFDIYRRLAIEPVSAAGVIVDNNVVNNVQYYYHIVAYNDYEATEPSEPFFVSNSYVMNPPTLLSVQQNLYDRAVTLAWGRNSNAEEGFRIYRRTSGASYRMIAQIPLTVTQYTDADTSSSLRIDSTYTYALRAFNSQEETALSNERTVTIYPPLYPQIVAKTGAHFIRSGTARAKNN
jgi:hypothetical protein